MNPALGAPLPPMPPPQPAVVQAPPPNMLNANALVGLGMMIVNPAISSMFNIPFQGALTRMRTTFNPVSKSGRVRENPLSGLIATFKRTYDLDGFSGIFKGFFAAGMQTVVGTLPTAGYLAYLLSSGALYAPPNEDGTPGTIMPDHLTRLSMWLSSLDAGAQIAMGILSRVGLAVASIPATVLWARLFSSPKDIPFSVDGFKSLMSSRERAAPWRIWLAPGLLTGTIAMSFAQWTLTALTLPLSLPPNDPAIRYFTITQVVPVELHAPVYILLHLLATAWVVPLTVAIAKIAAQPDADAETIGEKGAVASEEIGAGFPRASKTNEDVVNIRKRARYAGIWDAITTIYNEEGLGSLYRGWIWTAASVALTAVTTVQVAQVMEGGM